MRIEDAMGVVCDEIVHKFTAESCGWWSSVVAWSCIGFMVRGSLRGLRRHCCGAIGSHQPLTLVHDDLTLRILRILRGVFIRYARWFICSIQADSCEVGRISDATCADSSRLPIQIVVKAVIILQWDTSTGLTENFDEVLIFAFLVIERAPALAPGGWMRNFARNSIRFPVWAIHRVERADNRALGASLLYAWWVSPARYVKRHLLGCEWGGLVVGIIYHRLTFGPKLLISPFLPHFVVFYAVACLHVLRQKPEMARILRFLSTRDAITDLDGLEQELMIARFIHLLGVIFSSFSPKSWAAHPSFTSLSIHRAWPWLDGEERGGL